MEENKQSDLVHNAGEENAPRDSESFGNIPKNSEDFRNIRNDSEDLRDVRQRSERKENHTLTVREATRLFEEAGVARTERSIINWCQLNPQGVARLDSYFDPNERKYFITPESVQRAIAEEKAKAAKVNETAEPVQASSKKAERPDKRADILSAKDSSAVRELELQILDLKIANRGKDQMIEYLERKGGEMFDKLLDAQHRVGALETELRQLSEGSKELPQAGDGAVVS